VQYSVNKHMLGPPHLRGAEASKEGLNNCHVRQALKGVVSCSASFPFLLKNQLGCSPKFVNSFQTVQIIPRFKYKMSMNSFKIIFRCQKRLTYPGHMREVRRRNTLLVFTRVGTVQSQPRSMGKLHEGTQHGKIPRRVLKTQETRNNLGSMASRPLILGR